MLGLAQQLYVEKYAPRKKGADQRIEWPLLESLVTSGQLSYVDYALAQHLLQSCGESDEAFAAVICHLSMAARLGHLCVRSSQGRLSPSVEEVWATNESQAIELSKESIDALETMIIRGLATLPASIYADVDENIITPAKPICKWKTNVYLQRYWVLESHVLTHLKPLLGTTAPKIGLESSCLKQSLESFSAEKKLLPEQASAILHACQHSFTVITGGPGTGKTYTAGMLLRIVWEGLTPDERTKCRIDLAAPTGKAAANLEASIQRALQGVPDFPPLKAKTLHSLIPARQAHQFQVPLNTDILLIDESSMIDVQWMGNALASLKPGARLILLGDAYQLPPVGVGSLFADLVSYLKIQKHPHLIELKTCLRTELKSIIHLAETVKNGDLPALSSILRQCLSASNETDGIHYVALKEQCPPKEMQRRLLEYALPKFFATSAMQGDGAPALRQFSSFRLLTPLRQGPYGSEALNALFFQAAVKQCSQAEWMIAPIMVVQNCYQTGLFNGEVGMLIKFFGNDQKSYALFPSHGANNETGKIPALLLPKFEYAYCISIHKSQGSEFDRVLLLLPEGTESFGREALYTGMTRARRHLEIWSTEAVLESMIKRTSDRRSGVVERLLGDDNEKNRNSAD